MRLAARVLVALAVAGVVGDGGGGNGRSGEGPSRGGRAQCEEPEGQSQEGEGATEGKAHFDFLVVKGEIECDIIALTEI